MKKPSYVAHIDDERDLDNSIIVTLKEGYFFKDSPDCGVQGFDNWSEVKQAIKKSNILAAQKSTAAD